MSDFAAHLANLVETAHKRWRLSWELGAWHKALRDTREAARAAIEGGADFNFILFVLTSYRWRQTVPSRAAAAAQTFQRRLVKLYESALKQAGGPLGLERWLAPILGRRVVLVHDERSVFDEVASRNSRPLKGRANLRSQYGSQVKSDRLYECVGALDWYLRTSGVKRPAAVIAKLMHAFGFPDVRSGQKGLNWVHTRRHRMEKISPRTDGSLLSLLLQFHGLHSELLMPCIVACSYIQRGDRPLAVTYVARSARARRRTRPHIREHGLLVPDRIRDRSQRTKRVKNRRSNK